MVVMAIIGILAATAIVNIDNNADRDVRQERDRLSSFLREVQNKALTGDASGVSSGSGKICGYGVSVNGVSDANLVYSYYIISSSLNDDCSGNSVSRLFVSTQNIDTFYFKNGVSVSGTFPDIFFLVPNGIVYSGGAVSSATIPISLKKESITLHLFIDPSGNIYTPD
jgi:hypothetical protein